MASVEEIALPDPKERMATVLLVEDEVLIRMGLSHFLQECGFKVLEASNAAEAIAMLNAAETPIDVVFSDVRMPGAMDGFALAQWIHAHRPGLPILLTSGDKRNGGNCGRIVRKADAAAEAVRFPHCGRPHPRADRRREKANTVAGLRGGSCRLLCRSDLQRASISMVGTIVFLPRFMTKAVGCDWRMRLAAMKGDT